MKKHLYEFENLSSKSGFNSALGHFRIVSDLIGTIGDFTNIADTLNGLLYDKTISQNQLVPTVNALLYDKLQYKCSSFNITNTIENFDLLIEEAGKWNAIDIVLVYYHPDLGAVVINPKNKNHFESIHSFKRNELITIYAGSFSGSTESKLSDTAISLIINFLEGKKINTPAELKAGKFKPEVKKIVKKAITVPSEKKGAKKSKYSSDSPKKEETAAAGVSQKPEAVVSEKPKRMTPYYSVPVTNELFHNGNVEAWKKIIQSYNVKNPALEVYIYYDGERIHDIHSLFKWGKVKHGSTILFAVAGDDIKDVAKLQRYLKQGASIMFESFLKFPVNKILNLF